MELEQKEVDVVSTNEENTTNTETDTFGTEEQTVSINVYLYTQIVKKILHNINKYTLFRLSTMIYKKPLSQPSLKFCQIWYIRILDFF